MTKDYYLERKCKEEEFLAQPQVQAQRKKQQEQLRKLRAELLKQYSKVIANGK